MLFVPKTSRHVVVVRHCVVDVVVQGLRVCQGCLFPGALSSPLLRVPWEAQGRKTSSESTELLGLVGVCDGEGR